MELIDRAFGEIDRKNCAMAVFRNFSKVFDTDTLDHKILIKNFNIMEYEIKNSNGLLIIWITGGSTQN